MLIKLKPCPFCGKGEVAFVKGALRHTVPHQKKCSLFHLRTSEEVGAEIERFLEQNKDGHLATPVVATTQTWVGSRQPAMEKIFGHTLKLLDHEMS